MMLDRADRDIYNARWLINAAIDITSWEARSRYNDSPLSVRKEISEAIDMYEELKQQILLKQERSP